MLARKSLTLALAIVKDLTPDLTPDPGAQRRYMVSSTAPTMMVAKIQA